MTVYAQKTSGIQGRIVEGYAEKKSDIRGGR